MVGAVREGPEEGDRVRSRAVRPHGRRSHALFELVEAFKRTGVRDAVGSVLQRTPGDDRQQVGAAALAERVAPAPTTTRTARSSATRSARSIAGSRCPTVVPAPAGPRSTSSRTVSRSSRPAKTARRFRGRLSAETVERIAGGASIASPRSRRATRCSSTNGSRTARVSAPTSRRATRSSRGSSRRRRTRPSTFPSCSEGGHTRQRSRRAPSPHPFQEASGIEGERILLHQSDRHELAAG